jgi:hypothetical protein
MKNKLALYILAGTIGAAAFSVAGIASAHGFGFGDVRTTPEQYVAKQSELFASEATLLGISVDEVKAAWAEGKSLMQLATDKGITKEQLAQKIEVAHMAALKADMTALVDKGVITQAQADARIASMQARAAKMKGMKGTFGGMRKNGAPNPGAAK